MSQDDAAQVFALEALDLQASIERNLLDLSEDPSNRDLIDTLFRELHTLKGSSAMFGFTALSRFVHEFETAFETLREPGGRASADLVAVALAACDHFERLLTAPEKAGPDSEAILHRLRLSLGGGYGESSQVSFQGDVPPDLSVNAHTSAGPAQGTGQGDSPLADGWTIRLALGPQALSLGINPLGVLDDLRGLSADADIRILCDKTITLDALDPLEPPFAWEIRLPATVERAQLDDVFLFVSDDLSLDIRRAGTQAPDGVVEDQRHTEHPVPGATSPVTPLPPAAAGSDTETLRSRQQAPSSMRVETERLDELMDRVGELVIAEARLHEISADLGNGALLTIAEDIRRLTSGMRDTTMTIRMVPVGSLFGRCRRLVHDLSGQLGKPLDLVTTGGDTELDKTVIEALGDPLVHMLRNSVDHGIELPEVRRAAGKPDHGQITIAARQAGTEVEITIADDGKGLDLEKIRERAIERGLIQPTDHQSETQTRLLIFEPGFSTAPSVTELSGRGVGMDVVRTTLKALRGQIEVDSEPGHGTTIKLRLPLTLAIMDGLLVEVGTERYTIPLAAVEECVELPGELATGRGQSNFLRVRDELVPFLSLARLFDVPEPRAQWQKVVIVSSAAGRVGLLVDRIVSTNQTVIKQLSRLHEGLKNFSGATILGDGKVALILDVSNLVGHGQAIEAAARQSERAA
ncbi:chemotaxis protein CheA [uncultured Maritimibacter sp.]|jgi:two-component system chemotaxis sensor kinase CheA|uniref:chemotaxis protein CheA n=1 Tax=uncultured Maritimibacter sp. TaxID=991866 RepID=UPI000A57F774|nr:chemotaxis protein CheA [uncultured Maritimibacter sp.]